MKGREGGPLLRVLSIALSSVALSPSYYGDGDEDEDEEIRGRILNRKLDKGMMGAPQTRRRSHRRRRRTIRPALARPKRQLDKACGDRQRQ